MPIILQGTRSGASWGGIETILPEDLGRTEAASNAVTLARVNLKSGTPLADVKIWIGDWGTGQRSGTPGEENKCIFTMPVQSGCSAWDNGLWVTDPPGYYYLVLGDESWFSKITASDGNSVTCADNLPDADSHIFYVCPYAELYRSQAIPYKSDAEPQLTHPQTARHYERVASPVAPILLIKDLNLGGKYRIKAASVISGDNYTKWAEADFIVGSDLIEDAIWKPTSEYLTVEGVDGGVKVTISDPQGGSCKPDAYEACFTYRAISQEDPPTPSFTDDAHPTIYTSERVFKLDVPPGYKVKILVRALKYRMVMKDETTGNPKEITHLKDYVLAGGVGLRRNRKIFTNPIKEDNIASQGTALVDQQKIPDPIWPKSIALFNPTATTQKDFEVYVHGSNQNYTLGRKIRIGSDGAATEMITKAWVEQPISDYRITDPGVMITIKNVGGAQQSFDLRYTVEYCEDSEAELGKLGQE